MSKKEIVIICQFFYPEYISSATLPTELAEDLVSAGFSVDVLCGYPSEYCLESSKVSRKEDYNGIKIKRLHYYQTKRSGKIGRLINFFSFFIAIVLQSTSILKHKCVLVYSNPPVIPLIPALLRKFFGIKFIFVSYDIYPDLAILLNSISINSPIDKFMRVTNKLVYKYASNIIALGSEMGKYMIDKGLLDSWEKIRVIPNWYDRKKIQSNSNIKNQEFVNLRNEHRFIALYSGNMGTCQDIQTILSCIEILKDEDIFFVFTGHGNKVEEVKGFIEQHNLNNVTIYGFLHGKDYEDMLNLANCSLVSLEKGVEGMSVPSKTYGYLAAGKPVLAIMSKETDIAHHLATYQAGFAIEQGDSKTLANYIVELRNNRDMCKKMGENAIKIFEDHYDRHICTRKYTELFKEILKDDAV